MRRALLAPVAALACAAAAGCGASAGEGGGERAAASVPADCRQVAPRTGRAVPRELPRPEGTLIASESREADGQAIVQGFVARTPSAARSDLANRPGMRVLMSEDEGNDAEVSVSDGRHRTLYKLVKACPSGSRFTAVMVPEVP